MSWLVAIFNVVMARDHDVSQHHSCYYFHQDDLIETISHFEAVVFSQ